MVNICTFTFEDPIVVGTITLTGCVPSEGFGAITAIVKETTGVVVGATIVMSAPWIGNTLVFVGCPLVPDTPVTLN